jgi:hypothetical protein
VCYRNTVYRAAHPVSSTDPRPVRFVADIVPFVAEYLMRFGPISRLCSLSVVLCWAATIHRVGSIVAPRVFYLGELGYACSFEITRDLNCRPIGSARVRGVRQMGGRHHVSRANLLQAYMMSKLGHLNGQEGVLEPVTIFLSD